MVLAAALAVAVFLFAMGVQARASGSVDSPLAHGASGGFGLVAGDTDQDGCTDEQELGSNQALGGRRDPNNFWDFFDTPDGANQRDRLISAADLLRVVDRIGATGSATSVADALTAPPATGYHAAFDRSSPATGADLWNPGPADGAISAVDLMAIVAQFGHTCSDPGSTVVVTFDDLAGPGQVLEGQYPAGVIDWGTGTWWHSEPWQAMTTNSVTFNGEGTFSGTFTLLTAAQLVQLDVYNGGVAGNTVTLRCSGQADRSQLVSPGQLVSIQTGWTGTCGSVSISSENGWDTNFDNLVLSGDVPELPTPAPTPPPAATPTPDQPGPTAPPPPANWAFWETFDGAPASPEPYASPRFDIVVGGNDPDGTVDGQTIISDPPLIIEYGDIEAGHGPNCDRPDQNTRTIVADLDVEGFQTNTRQHLVFQCNNHMMTAIKGGYAVGSFMPRQLFDWDGRMGTIEIDTSLYTFGREWFDVFIVPEDEMLLDMQDFDEAGAQENLPQRAVRFSMHANKPNVTVFDNYQEVEGWNHWQQFREAFPDDIALSDPRIRRTLRMQLSQTGWRFEIEKQDGTFWTFSGNFEQPLSFTRGLIRFEHHSYNPTKDGIFGTPWSQFTYHWDNLKFDGPALPGRQAFEAAPGLVELQGVEPGTVSAPVVIDVGPNMPDSPRLVGHLFSQLDNDEIDPLNNSHWRQVRVNGGAWQDVGYVKNVAQGRGGGGGWSTIGMPLQGITAGENVLEFLFAARPPEATWHWNGFRVKDLEIQTEDRPAVAVVPSSVVESAELSAFVCGVPASHTAAQTPLAFLDVEPTSSRVTTRIARRDRGERL